MNNINNDYKKITIAATTVIIDMLYSTPEYVHYSISVKHLYRQDGEKGGKL